MSRKLLILGLAFAARAALLCAAEPIPIAELEKTDFLFGEDVFFWVGVDDGGHPIPAEDRATCRLHLRHPNGSTEEREVGWIFDGQIERGWKGGQTLAGLEPGRYSVQFEFAGIRSPAREFTVRELPLLEGVHAKLAFAGRLIDCATDVAVEMRVDNATDQVIRFPKLHYDPAIQISIFAESFDPPARVSGFYPFEKLLQPGDEVTKTVVTTLTWANMEFVPHVVLAPGESFSRMLSVKEAFGFRKIGTYRIGLSTTIQVLLGERDGPYAKLSPARIPVSGSTEVKVREPTIGEKGYLPVEAKWGSDAVSSCVVEERWRMMRSGLLSIPSSGGMLLKPVRMSPSPGGMFRISRGMTREPGRMAHGSRREGHGWVQALGAGSLDADRPMRYKYLVALSVRLPEEVEARLDALARKTGRTKTFYVREAIVEHIEDLEDYFLALERMQNPEGDPVSLEDVIARLGLVDSV